MYAAFFGLKHALLRLIASAVPVLQDADQVISAALHPPVGAGLTQVLQDGQVGQNASARSSKPAGPHTPEMFRTAVRSRTCTNLCREQ